jgi:predicted mannosyl-3-phosphoglycerate phosphatase (HAD superfamily)
MPLSENVMIIRGFAKTGSGLCQTFSGIPRNRSALFLKSSATEPAFFRNSQESIRSFFEILSNRAGLFPEFPGIDPLIF